MIRAAELAVVALVSAASAAYIQKRTQRTVDAATDDALGIIQGAIDRLTDEVATANQAEAIVARATHRPRLRVADQRATGWSPRA